MPAASHHQILAALEALLFVSGEPLAEKRLRELLDLDEQALEHSLTELQARYADDSMSGLMLIRHEGAAELATKPSESRLVEAFTKSFLQEHLSKPALEVLAIVAYRGPITRAAIEAIRGVNCSFTLRNLLLRGLIGREENPLDTREYVYTATIALLEKLGIQDQTALPDFATLARDERLLQSLPQDKDLTPPLSEP